MILDIRKSIAESNRLTTECFCNLELSSTGLLLKEGQEGTVDHAGSTARNKRASAWAYGEPLTTDMDDIDHECYLNAPPLCNILFPTDFDFLTSFLRRAWKQKPRFSDDLQKRVVTVQKEADFLQMYGPHEVRSTKSWLTGYSPLLHDLVNCSGSLLYHEECCA